MFSEHKCRLPKNTLDNIRSDQQNYQFSKSTKSDIAFFFCYHIKNYNFLINILIKPGIEASLEVLNLFSS